MYLSSRRLSSRKIVLNNDGTYSMQLVSFAEVISRLENERDKEIIALRYSGKTMAEVGKLQDGISRQRIEQIEIFFSQFLSAEI